MPRPLGESPSPVTGLRYIEYCKPKYFSDLTIIAIIIAIIATGRKHYIFDCSLCYI